MFCVYKEIYVYVLLKILMQLLFLFIQEQWELWTYEKKQIL